MRRLPCSSAVPSCSAGSCCAWRRQRIGSDASVFSGAEYASPLLRPLLTSPFDYLLTAIAASSLVALLLYALAAWRLTFWPPRMSLHRPGERACGRRRVTGRTIGLFAVTQIAAGTVVAFVLIAYRGFLQDTVANTTIDLLHYSLHPWSTSRLALQVGLILWHATALGCGVLILRAALIPWSVPRNNRRLRAATIAMWALPLIMWQFLSGADRLPSLVALAVIIASVAYSSRLEARYRHGSQALPAHHDDVGAAGTCGRLLSVDVRPRTRRQGPTRGNTFCPAGDQSPSDSSGTSRGKPRSDR